MFRRRRHGIEQAAQDVPVGLFCFELLYADGEDLTDRPYPERRAALAEALILSDRLQLTTTSRSASRRRWTPPSPRRSPTAARGWSARPPGPTSGYRAGARGWSWIKLKRDYRTELADTVDLVVVGAYAGRGRRTGSYGAVLLAAYDPETELYRTVGRCGAGFTDADLAVLPERLAPLIRPDRHPRVDSRVPADLWCEPGLVLEVLSRRAHRLAQPHGRLGAAPARLRAGHAVPPLHRPVARRQGAPGRHHHRAAGRPVPHRPPTLGPGRLNVEISVAWTPGGNLRIRRLRPLDAGCNLRRAVDAYVNVGFDDPEDEAARMMGRCPKATASTRRPASSMRR